jgi:hypothetical protein
VLLGRRAHFHGAFNNPELEELGGLDGVDILVEHGDQPDNHEAVLGELDATTRRKLATLETYANRSLAGHDKRIVLRFLTSPIEVLGEPRVTGLLVSRNHLVRDGTGLTMQSTGPPLGTRRGSSSLCRNHPEGRSAEPAVVPRPDIGATTDREPSSANGAAIFGRCSACCGSSARVKSP